MAKRLQYWGNKMLVVRWVAVLAVAVVAQTIARSRWAEMSTFEERPVVVGKIDTAPEAGTEPEVVDMAPGADTLVVVDTPEGTSTVDVIAVRSIADRIA